MARKATGSLALMGFVLDDLSGNDSAGHPNYALGHPGLVPHVVTPPAAAPSGAAGAAGNLTGRFIWRVAFGTPDGKYTSPSPWTSDTHTGSGLNDMTFSGLFTNDTWVVTIDASVPSPDTFTWTKNGGAASASIPITGAAQLLSNGVYVTFAAIDGHTIADSWTRGPAVDLTADIGSITAIPTSADTAVDRRVIERGTINVATGVLTRAVCGRVYDRGTTNTFDDNVAVLDMSDKLSSVNQTGGNGGVVFVPPNSFDLDPQFSIMPVSALMGTQGQPRGVPGTIKLDAAPKEDLRIIDLYPCLVTGAGTPDSISQVAGEPTFIAEWNATTCRRNPRSASALGYKGSPDVPPLWFYQGRCSEVAISFASGKITDITPKWSFGNYGTAAHATKISGTGTWKGTFVLMGERNDSLKLTDVVRIKITRALAGGYLQFKVARGSGGSYSGAAQTLYCDGATSGRQTKGGSQFNDGVEMLCEDGTIMGHDIGSNRQPVLLYASEAITTANLAVDDIYEFALTPAIPGVGAAPYSGIPASFMRAPRLTGAHVTLTKDGSVIEAQSGTLTLLFSTEDVTALGPGNRTIQDMPNSGYSGAKLSITKFLDSPEYRTVMSQDDRIEAVVALVVDPIPINPGVNSTHHEGIVVTIPQLALDSVKSNPSAPKLIPEAISGYAEEPGDTDRSVWEVVMTARNLYNLPA